MNSILKQHNIFVDGVTSEDSKNNQAWFERLTKLDQEGVDLARLVTAVMGLSGESGETIDLVKKVLFHGKPWTDDIRKKLLDEASDIAWYWQNLCIAIGEDPEEILKHNIKKLESRYPGGKFSIERSEVRDRELDPKYQGKNV